MRRVVVTGLGMVTPLACGVEPTWQRLINGDSGARCIETFDVSDLAAKIACQVPRGDGADGSFNADQWMEPCLLYTSDAAETILTVGDAIKFLEKNAKS